MTSLKNCNSVDSFVARAWRGAMALLLAAVALAPGRIFAANTLTYPGAAPCNTTLQACLAGATSSDAILLAFNDANSEVLSVTDKNPTVQPTPPLVLEAHGAWRHNTSFCSRQFRVA